MPKTKQESYDLWQRGRFGNYVRSWPTGLDAVLSGYYGPVTLRYKSPTGGGGPCVYDLGARECDIAIDKYVARGPWRREHFYVNEALPKQHMAIQGELMRCPDWYLFGNTAPLHMRDALRKENHPREWRGAEVLVLLRRFLDPSSFEDAMCLVDEFPEAVLEFTCLTVDFGAVKNRNTVIWECRDGF